MVRNTDNKIVNKHVFCVVPITITSDLN